MEDGELQDTVVVLRCFDGEEFRVPSALARRRSELVITAEGGTHGEQHDDDDVVVPVPGDIAGGALAAVIAYWVSRDEAAARGADLGRYDAEFVAALSHDARVDVINAAYHLNEHDLLELFAPPKYHR